MTPAEASAEVQRLFPPGVIDDVLAPDEGAGNDGAAVRHLTAGAQTVLDQAILPAEDLERDITPLTCGAFRMRQWEGALDVLRTKTANFGTLEHRRRAVIARLREYGPPTKEQIQAVLGPLLDYADPSQLVILECDRAALRAAHTYLGARAGGSVWSYSTPARWRFWVNDAARVAPGCVQADLVLSTADLETVAVDLVAPDGVVWRVPFGKVGRGAAAARPTRVYWHGVTQSNVLGLWEVRVWADAPPTVGTLDDASLFCEGFGRRGLASAQFEWAAVFEPSKSNGAPDFAAAREAVLRLGFATRIGGLVFVADPAVGLAAGDWAMVPNDNALPGGCVPG